MDWNRRKTSEYKSDEISTEARKNDIKTGRKGNHNLDILFSWKKKT